MLAWSPDTAETQLPGGYAYADHTLKGFSLTHFSGRGCTVYQDVPILPVLGTDTHPTFQHANETASPGDYAVTLFGESAPIKQHANRLTLEIRNAASDQPADVKNVQIQSSMRMPGMGPMFAEVGTLKMVSAGKYEFNADFSMAGQWSFVVTFDPNGRAQFNLNAQ